MIERIYNWVHGLFYPGEAMYWKGRTEGWFACENMVVERIKRYYPDNYEKMIEDIIQ